MTLSPSARLRDAGLTAGKITTEIEYRPFLIALVGLCVGIEARSATGALIILLPLLLLARSPRAWVVACTGLLVGYLAAPPEVPILVSPRFLSGELRIASEPVDTGVDLRCNGEVGALRVRVVAPKGSSLHLGQHLAWQGTVQPVAEYEEANYRAQGLQGKVAARSVHVVQEAPTILLKSSQIRDLFQKFVKSSAGAGDAAFVEALWFRTSPLPREETLDGRSVGTYSLLSASGLHVYVLTAFVISLGRSLRLPRLLQLLCLALVLLFYWLAAGLPESTFRAALSCLVLASAYLFDREPDLITATCLCGVVYLIFSPRSLFTLGFQLSILIPIFLGFYLPRLRSGQHINRKTRVGWRPTAVFGATLIVISVSQPLIAFHTGSFSLAGPVSAVLLAAVAPVLLGAVLAAFLLHFVVPVFANGLMISMVAPLVHVTRSALNSTAVLSPAYPVPHFESVWLLAWFGLMILAWRPREVSE